MTHRKYAAAICLLLLTMTCLLLGEEKKSRPDLSPELGSVWLTSVAGMISRSQWS